jgi:hypothetical protein
MGGINRGRLLVDTHGAWRLYTQTLPAGSKAIGTVTRGVETGALVRMQTGMLALVAAGCCHSLDQSKAEAALRANNV